MEVTAGQPFYTLGADGVGVVGGFRSSYLAYGESGRPGSAVGAAVAGAPLALESNSGEEGSAAAASAVVLVAASGEAAVGGGDGESPSSFFLLLLLLGVGEDGGFSPSYAA